MVSRKLTAVLGLAMLVLLVAAACSRDGETIPPTRTPTRVATVTMGVTPILDPTSTPLPVVISRPTPVSDPVDGYLTVAPSILRSNATESISVALFSSGRPASGQVEVTLLSRGVPVSRVAGFINGQGSLDIEVPSLADGAYELEISGPGFTDRATLMVEARTVLFLETDKPINKPGQTVHIRVLTLDPDLMPVVGTVEVEVQDAKGIKIFKKVVTSDEYGMATLDLPLSTEPNLGTWKIKALSGKREAQTDIRVEEYVLPKYDVNVDLPRSWILAGEPVRGSVSSEYSFGRPVKSELTIVATRYVGTWEEYARVVEQIDGTASFELPAPGYVAGVPGARGMGNVQLEVTVRERSTGYEEVSTYLLTVAPTPLSIQVIPEGTVFKPGLPFSFLVVTETPDNRPLSEEVSVRIVYMDKDLDVTTDETVQVTTHNGKALLTVTPPSYAVAFTMEVTGKEAHASLTVNAGYSPSGSFIHVEQAGDGPLRVGDVAEFHVAATRQGGNFYFEVLSRGTVVFSDYSSEPIIMFTVTPLMAPEARVLVYQILPTSEVAADYLPFSVEAVYPHDVAVQFGEREVRPGDPVDINVQTHGEARVGLVVVDRSVYILAENRLNLQQVFAQLEELYQQPQIELHEARPIFDVYTRGAQETFDDAGVVVMSNQRVPEGKEYQSNRMRVLAMDAEAVQRVRQFFPETWLWTDLFTDQSGRGTVAVIAPDSITTWMLRAVGVSKTHGLGISEAELTVFQEFFLQVDLPFSAIRGEELPVRVALYNYLDTPQDIFVDLEATGDFDLLDDAQKIVTVPGNDIGGATFVIRPKALGTVSLKVTARSTQAADAVIKKLLVEPEGVARETVENLVLSAGSGRIVDASIPSSAIPGSGRVYVTVTGSYLTQSIEGLERLLQMPFGCGEQNMILFAPNVFVARYLRETGQLKPEVMARAENLMITGYQRELTYRRSDGSFEPVGFLHHQELLGGLQGENALTAFVTVALLEAGQGGAAARAVSFLEGLVDRIDDPYAMALTSYALELADSPSAGGAFDRLMGMAKEDEDGLHWGDRPVPLPLTDEPDAGQHRPIRPQPGEQSAAIETTGYATMALLEHGDRFNASRAARWLVTRRNAFGGFGSTQDTVVGLQALTQFSTASLSDVDMTIVLSAGSWERQVRITPANADVLQIVEVPEHGAFEVAGRGKGDAVVQVVRRFNLPNVEPTASQAFQITVDYGTEHVAVDDLITVSASVRFTPFEYIEAGMVVLDIAVPTGFAPVTASIDALVEAEPKLKRFDVAGRKVILYIEDMLPDERIELEFTARALYPVRAQAVTSEVYSYYNPEMRGETLGGALTVEEG